MGTKLTGKTVSLAFSLETDHEVIDGAPEESPFVFVGGSGKLNPHLEGLLANFAVGEEFDLHLEDNLAFGSPKNDLSFEIARRKLPEKLQNIEMGMYFETLGPDKLMHRFRVIEAGELKVKIDGNHPLAGKALRFSGKIVAIK